MLSEWSTFSRELFEVFFFMYITMNSLMQLRAYDESDSEEEESLQKRLPRPGFLDNPPVTKLSPEINSEGKIRNFPHEPGNWATYIHIPVDLSELDSYLGALLDYFKPLNLKLVDDFHVSVTKTVILRHHWISEFISSVKSSLQQVNSFKIHLFGLKAFVNEQKTRSFLSLNVDEGENDLNLIISQLKPCFRDYNLQGFYKHALFHVSLLWCPGDKFNEINKHIVLLPQKLKNFDMYQRVSHCVCTTGNKQFTFTFNQ